MPDAHLQMALDPVHPASRIRLASADRIPRDREQPGQHLAVVLLD
ncbi:hypothetical protein [Aeromonas bestiarum]|nr:hypothetical protein [Aeromonas bestiarum]